MGNTIVYHDAGKISQKEGVDMNSALAISYKLDNIAKAAEEQMAQIKDKFVLINLLRE